jgi:hypothetical protein
VPARAGAADERRADRPRRANLPSGGADDMVSHMKTTVDIADALLVKAKQVAVAEGSTLRELIEEGLRRSLEERQRRRSFRLRKATFRGRGVQAPLAEGSWEQIRALAYEGHGG